MDKLFSLILVVAIAFLAFVGGAFVVLTKVFPYDYFNDAYQAMVAVYHQSKDYQSAFQTNLWRLARTDERGVTRHDASKAYDGFTLYTSAHAQKAFLIDMDGKVVREWSLPIREIWDNTDREPRPKEFVAWDYVYMYPNGDLLAMYAGAGETPWGYGLIKMDRNSKVIWKYWDHVHHDLDIAKDGRIHVLTNQIQKNVIEGYEHLEPPRIDDYVVVLSPEGKPLKRVSILDALLNSRYGRMMRAGPSWNIQSDFLHTNSIQIIDRTLASKLPFAKEGQVLLSLRDIDTIAILDLDSEEVIWALRGPWHRQHDADILANGNFLLFDNYGHYEQGGMSQVIEFKPSPLDVVWTYHGKEQHLFESGIRSTQDRLPNGNTLITESDGGRIVEVTRGGEMVWEFINPVRAGEGDRMIPVILFGVDRVTPDQLNPEFLTVIDRVKSSSLAVTK